MQEVMTLGAWPNIRKLSLQQLHLNTVLSGPSSSQREIHQKGSNLRSCKPLFLIGMQGLEMSLPRLPLPHKGEQIAKRGWEAKINNLPRPQHTKGEACPVEAGQEGHRKSLQNGLFHKKGTSMPVWVFMTHSGHHLPGKPSSVAGCQDH